MKIAAQRMVGVDVQNQREKDDFAFDICFE